MGPETMRVLAGWGLSLEQAATLEEALRADMSAMSAVDIEADTRADKLRVKWLRQKRNQRARGGHEGGQGADPSSQAEVPPHPPKTQPINQGKAPTLPSVASGPKGRTASHECPPIWEPSAKVLEVGAAEGLTPGEIERELAKMRDHRFHDAHRDWDAVARNWLRTAAERKGKPNGSGNLFEDLRTPKRRAHEQNMQNAAGGLSAAAGRLR
jgi:hypothetical protein